MNPPPVVFCVIYFFTFFLALVGVVTSGKFTSNLDGSCLLFTSLSNVSLDNHTNDIVFKLASWGVLSNCTYIFVVHLSVVLYTLFMEFSGLILMKKQIDRTPFSSFVQFICNCLLTFLMFVSAILLSYGYHTFCLPIFDIDPKAKCTQLDLSLLVPASSVSKVDSSAVFNNFKALDFTVWFSMFLLAISSCLAFFKVLYFHRNNDLLQSLAYEKERLINNRSQYSVIVYEEQQ